MTTPLFSATSSSPRQILLLLRCLASTKKTLVRISPSGLRFSTDEGSTLESYLVLSRNLFTTYTYHPPPPASSQDDTPEPPSFEINLNALLETLNIFSLSDPTTYTNKRSGGEDAFSSHRSGRHAGINAFASRGTLGVTGLTTFSYDGAGSKFGIFMSESGITTTSELTTYEADVGGGEEIPFNREDLALKTIMRASALLDAVGELSSLGPGSLCVAATPTSSRLVGAAGGAANLSLSAAGAFGEVKVDFSTTTSSETPVLETFQCQRRVSSHYRFSAIKSAQRAMGAATKVSVRMDGEGVLSLQFLVEVDGGGSPESVAFVDFRVVPLVEGEADEGGEDLSESD
ncbi:checkpoint clamp complex protein Rad1 [Elasticomyces elasticus]|nr:checkpoint clamp complex protein Rad1 [Elasticomyces elasticus]KAK4968603.1 checkpoint clamp complex protein Rad1 [Elasticomyces elasticus]